MSAAAVCHLYNKRRYIIIAGFKGEGKGKKGKGGKGKGKEGEG